MDQSIMSVPIRKRTVRACDQCRRRKTKCDGKMSCSACSNIGLGCSYGHQIKQTRGPTYVVHLEKKVEELEKQVRRKSSDSSLSTQDSSQSSPPDTSVSPSLAPRVPKQRMDSAISLPLFDFNSFDPGNKPQRCNSDISESASFGETFRDRQRSFTVALPRQTVYSGPEALKRVRQMCDQVAGLATVGNDPSSAHIAEAFDRSFPFHSLSSSVMSYAFLPSKERLLHWIDVAFRNAFCLWPCVDRSSVDWNVHRIYNTDTFGRGSDDRDHLALIYIILALGQRFDQEYREPTADSSELKGLAFFGAANEIVGLTDAGRNYVSLQVTICMVIYLTAANAMSAAHTYVCTAATNALRMGLHKAANDHNLPDEDRFLRQQTFSFLKVLDTYISSFLGLPSVIRFKDPATGIDSTKKQKAVSESAQAARAHANLLEILSRAVEISHLTNSSNEDDSFPGRAMDRIWRVMEELDAWAAGLPSSVLTNAGPGSQSEPQLMLIYAYAYVQMLVFEPFLPQMIHNSTGGDVNAQFCGSRCVQAAFQAVTVAEEIERKGHLREGYFLTVLALALATTILAFVELNSSADCSLNESKMASKRAKALLERLAPQSRSASQFLESLKLLQDGQLREPLTPHVIPEYMPFIPSFGSGGSFSDIDQQVSPIDQTMVTLPALSNPIFAEPDMFWTDKTMNQPFGIAGTW